LIENTPVSETVLGPVLLCVCDIGYTPCIMCCSPCFWK